MAQIAHSSQISASIRTETGKGASRRARREGLVPAVLYGHGTQPQHLLLPAQNFSAILRHAGANAVLALDIEGTEQLALTKSVDVHPIRRTIEHADLLVITRGEKVSVEVPVELEGHPFPGALVTVDADHIEVEAEALSIPDQLVISIEGLQPGQLVLAKDVVLPAGVELVSDPELIVLNVSEPHASGDDAAEGSE